MVSKGTKFDIIAKLDKNGNAIDYDFKFYRPKKKKKNKLKMTAKQSWEEVWKQALDGRTEYEKWQKETYIEKAEFIIKLKELKPPKHKIDRPYGKYYENGFYHGINLCLNIIKKLCQTK